MIPPRVLVLLVTSALALPVAICVLVAVARLLAAMGDLAGGAAVDRVALGAGVTWIVLLVCLVLTLGIHALLRQQEPPEE